MEYLGVDAFIDVLNANGVEHIFFNPGGDTCPLQVALLKYRAMGKAAPKLQMCLHESVAMTAAHGHYMVSGLPQVVMVHSELGTQQVGGALHNAQWGRVPIILMAGSMAGPKRTMWTGGSYDQGLMVRNCVKWDHQIGLEEELHGVFQKAFDVAMTEPRGPVYLSYGRDAFARDVKQLPVSVYKKQLPGLPMPDSGVMGRMADELVRAKNPLIVAGSTGRYPETIRELVELAEATGAPVMPGLTRMNFPTDHPLCSGMEEIGGGANPNEALKQADLVLAVDYDMPYVPAEGMPHNEATILHIDVDPLTQGRELWGRGANLFLKADSREAIPALTKLVRAKTDNKSNSKVRDRVKELTASHERRNTERRAFALGKAKEWPIHPDWVAYLINRAIDPDTIVVNHLISQSSSLAAQVDRTKPFSLLACAGGSIMWALGAALGAKVAKPDKTVVSVMTDGGFVWGCPVAALWSAASLNAPFLSVIFNNRSYGAIRSIVERMTEGHLSDEQGAFCGVDISPPADYSMVARACGGYGEKVEDPEKLETVLAEGLAAVREGRPAVIDVWIKKG